MSVKSEKEIALGFVTGFIITIMWLYFARLRTTNPAQAKAMLKHLGIEYDRPYEEMTEAELKGLLNNCVEEENYEQACKIRDFMIKLDGTSKTLAAN